MGKEMEMMNQTLLEQKPYAFIVTDGTGQYPKQNDELFHAEVQLFRYNEESGHYESAEHFEKMIKVSAENTEKIDFKKYGINKEEYQEKMIPPSRFADEFFSFMEETLHVSDNGTEIPLFIGSGRDTTSMDFLDKTAGSAETFKENHIEILSVVPIIKDFLKENGIEGGQSVSALHKFMNPDGKTDNTSKGKIALYQKMIEQHYDYLIEQTAEKTNITVVK